MILSQRVSRGKSVESILKQHKYNIVFSKILKPFFFISDLVFEVFNPKKET